MVCAMDSPDPALEEYFEIVSRNAHRARVRLTLEKYRGQMGWDTAPKDADGNIINDPSDDELPPKVSDGLLLAQDSFSVLEPSRNVSPNLKTPSKRPPPPSHSVGPGRNSARIDPTSMSKDAQDFATRHAVTNLMYIITVSDEQEKTAGREPARGWPTFSVRYPDGDPTEVIHDPVSNPKNFRGGSLDPN